MLNKIQDIIQTKFAITKAEINIALILIFGLTFGYFYNLIFNDNLSEQQIKEINYILDSLEQNGKSKYVGTDLEGNYYYELANKTNQKKQKNNNSNRYKIKPIDIRTASKIEIMRLPKIGESTASEIIKYRELNGFSNQRDIMLVKGIGIKTYAKIKKYLIKFETKENEKSYKNETKLLSNVLVDLNTATKKELMSLKGIGSTYADRIIEFRKQNPFTKKEDLMKVKGIGKSKYNKIENNIKVDIK